MENFLRPFIGLSIPRLLKPFYRQYDYFSFKLAPLFCGRTYFISFSLWWAITTATTVGYGDISPTTNIGKFIAAFLMIGGVGPMVGHYDCHHCWLW